MKTAGVSVVSISASANVAARSVQIFIGHALHTQTKTPDSGSYDVINGPLRNARKFSWNLTPILPSAMSEIATKVGNKIIYITSIVFSLHIFLDTIVILCAKK